MLRAIVIVLVTLPLTARAQTAEPVNAEAPPAEAPPAESTATSAAMTSAQPPAPAVEAPATPNKFPSGLRVMASDLTILRINPLGLETRARIGVQKKLYASNSKITENNFFFAGVFPKLNPASAHLGVGGEIQPASIFNLRAFAEIQKYFGSLGYLQSFASPNANYSDQTLADNKDTPTSATEPQSATATRISIQPMVQLKLGKFAVRALAMFDYWNFNVRGGDTAVYEATYDTLLPNGGWSLSTDTDVLYVTGPLAAGLRHSWVHPFYTSKSFTGAGDEMLYDGDNEHQRLGLFGAYTLKDAGPSSFNKPTLIVIASWYLTHRYRAGEPSALPMGGRSEDYQSRAFPYLLAGFAFESDLI